MEELMTRDEELDIRMRESTDPQEIMEIAKELGLEMPMDVCKNIAKRNAEIQSVVLEADDSYFRR